MLQPARQKWRKMQKGRMRGKATRGNELSHGDFGLMALEPGWITQRQIEAARVALIRHAKRGGKPWIKIFPDKPITKKPAETRMGSGKGMVEYYVAVAKPGRILFELAGVEHAVAKEAFRRCAAKLPVKCRFIERSTGAF
jgi:large subunit ribosomal protein L16